MGKIMAGKAQRQHYIPQFLLRNFSAHKKRQICVYDKATGKSFSTNIKNIAAEHSFYDFTFEDSEYTIEPALAQIEGNTAQLFKHIKEQESVNGLTKENKIVLAQFFAIQLTRTKQWRARTDDLIIKAREEIRSRGFDPNQLDELKVFSENEKKISSIRQMFKCDVFAPHFINKTWMLQKTTRTRPFYIGDHPIVMHNSNDFGPYGNIGFAVRGIEIYFPISRYLVLGMWCPSIETGLRQNISNHKSLSFQHSLLAPNSDSKSLLVEQLLNCIESGAAMPTYPENVKFLNSLQVYYAERFVFSCSSDFNLIERMISNNPEIKKGPRVTIG